MIPANERTAWSLGRVKSSGRVKRLHRPDCTYARIEYVWAGEKTEDELFDALQEDGAFRWHEACLICTDRLDERLYRARVEAGCERE